MRIDSKNDEAVDMQPQRDVLEIAKRADEEAGADHQHHGERRPEQRSTRAAVEEGVVAGGGVALLRARANLKDLKGDNPDQDAGIKIVLRALEKNRDRRFSSAREFADALERLGPEARLIAGGHSLLPLLKMRLGLRLRRFQRPHRAAARGQGLPRFPEDRRGGRLRGG